VLNPERRGEVQPEFQEKASPQRSLRWSAQILFWDQLLLEVLFD
jgi:hypothetical protein